MTDRPIIFSAAMVKALLAGRKTQTRRLIRGAVPPAPAMDAIKRHNKTLHPAPYLDAYCGEPRTATNPRRMSDRWCWWTRDDRQCLSTFKVPCAPGDRFWVREAWRAPAIWDALAPRDIAWGMVRLYEADGSQLSGMHDDCVPFPVGTPGRRRAPMHLPRWASRLTLLVTDVRVQRLQDINDKDAVAEGMDWQAFIDGTAEGCSPRESFMLLWNHLHGPDAWSANPWVAAISFDCIHGNIDRIPDLNIARDAGLKAAE